MSFTAHAGAVLTIDLGAIVANWRLLRTRAAPAECAAVVKADAYGLGAAEVASVLAGAGCRVFFVATVDEGIALRHALAAPVPEPLGSNTGDDVEPSRSSAGPPAIFVLNGVPQGAEAELAEFGLIPVLNSLTCIEAWSRLARWLERALPAAVHVDTGMSRLGLPPAELRVLADDPRRLEGILPTLVMSHLACADEHAHPLNATQLHAFATARRMLPQAPGSLANSSGIFLGADYVCELVRPGAALYGVNPQPWLPNPMQGPVRLDAKILQVREIDSGTTVGYGATHRANAREKIATVAAGYADGFLRSLGNTGSGYIGPHCVPLVGRVSMDLITFDVTNVPDTLATRGSTIELIGPSRPVDAVAADAGTIGYEILTSLGSRYARAYVSSGS